MKGVIELASFHPFSAIHQLFLDQLMESIGVVLNMITANMRTEELLGQSQKLTQELQSQSKELTAQQEEMRRTNLELEEKARLLAEQNRKVEEKNREVEQARIAVEEKAQQLALISTYKSEFLANMSHELRTPLNSLLILAKLLAENPETNLTAKQVEFAKTIHASGGDLLALINEILDLSKVEAGKMQVESRNVPVRDLVDFVERTFRPVADEKGLALFIEATEDLPASMRTDTQRLQQVFKNLLSNAFKFTAKGTVTLRISSRTGTGVHESSADRGRRVIAFSVIDTGSASEGQAAHHFRGVSAGGWDHEPPLRRDRSGAVHQPRDSRLLGGEIQVVSTPGDGSTFTLFLPGEYVPVEEHLAVPRGAEREHLYSGGGPQTLSSGTATIVDDRESIREGDRVLLIIEDDEKFARILVNMAGDSGFKAIVAARGDTGIAMAQRVSSGCHHARRSTPSHRRALGLRAPEEKPADQPHSGPRHLRRREERGNCARRVRLS